MLLTLICVTLWEISLRRSIQTFTVSFLVQNHLAKKKLKQTSTKLSFIMFMKKILKLATLMQ